MYFEIFQIILQENVKSTLHFWLLSQTNSQKAVFYQFVSRFKPKHILVVFDSLFLTLKTESCLTKRKENFKHQALSHIDMPYVRRRSSNE